MSKTNVRASAPPVFTHEGARAYPHLKPIDQLRRSVLSCLLWESEFYEDGATIADRIRDIAADVPVADVSALAIEARNVHGLRHAPLMLLLRVIAEGGPGVAETVDKTIRRVDEIGELVSLFWQVNGKHHMIPKQMKLGLQKAFARFQEYHFAKYDRDGAIKLRDVLRLVRPKPVNEEQSALFKRIKDRTLATPDTWETELSGGKGKRETFERLIREGKLGYLALLRNLRGMMDAGVDRQLVVDAILARKGADLVFPFRYVAAARAVPQLEPAIDQALVASINGGLRLAGRTVVLVDVSRSMDAKLSGKSDLTRLDAAAALASVLNGDLRVFSFSDAVVEVPPRRGMAGVEAVIKSQVHNGTRLFDAVDEINRRVPYDRIIVITDEQATGGFNNGMIQGAISRMPDPKGIGYVINVASAQNGVGYGAWRHIDGFSEGVIRYIAAVEETARQ